MAGNQSIMTQTAIICDLMTYLAPIVTGFLEGIVIYINNMDFMANFYILQTTNYEQYR